MELTALYDLAQKKNIEVLQYPMQNNESMSIMLDNGVCYIGIDDAVQDGGSQERVHLAHELGHCETGSFYSVYTAVDRRQRHENRADKWAIHQLIPVDELDRAIDDGCTEIWALAERFGVTEQFIRKAICLYAYGNVATEMYF